MADYYPVLARAVSRLAINNAQAREELYEQARTVQAEQLRTYDPQFSVPETINERIAVEVAILRLEAEMKSRREKRLVLADHVPLHNANDAPDIASLLREPRILQLTSIDSAHWDWVGPAPCLLRPPG